MSNSFKTAIRPATIPRPPRKRFALIYLPLVLSTCLATFAIWQIEKPKSNSFNIIAQDEPIWGSLFTNNLKTIIVMGDYYVFALPIDSSRQSYIRDIAINSDEDLEAFMASHPALSQKIRKTYHTYLEELLPKCVAYVLPSFVSHDKPLELKLASELQLEDLQKSNIVYIGPYKTLQILKTVTRNLNFKYSPQTGGSVLTFALQDSNKVLTYSWVTNPETKARNDYAMVIKVFGYNGNVLLFFMSEHDFGNVATVKYLTNPTTLKEFGGLVASGNFEALFEVKGIVHTDFSTQLLQINKLHADFQIDLP